MAQMTLQRLGPESWGDKLRRAREFVGLTIRDVETQLFPHVSRSALTRLEGLSEVPADRKNRGRAALLLLLYGFELEDFDLGDTDLPPVIDLKALERLRKQHIHTRWCIHASLASDLAAA
jgi:hypothetical protein